MNESKLKLKLLTLAAQRVTEKFYEDKERISMLRAEDPNTKLEMPQYPDAQQIVAEMEILYKVF